ncbi:MAG: hypothetical protein HW416_3086 [Chloroflexi bacterium]|nr:hypothetical protein [Chloroflexota bacterium]
MRPRVLPRSRWLFMLMGLALLAACAAPPPAREAASTQQAAPAEAPRRGGSITLAVGSLVPVMGVMGSTTPTGGWAATAEVHSNALVTSDYSTRKPIGRLAERLPTIDDGGISLLPDGRMRVVFPIRKGVTWQDGAPFTAHDMVFTAQFNSDPGIPTVQTDIVTEMQSAEAPDDYTFVLYYKGPYYRGDQLGMRNFWPQPRHILGPAYERFKESNTPDEVLNHPYWTSEYVHTGPFRLTSFDPADAIVFRAYDDYFLGRPKVDVVRIRIFSDLNTLYSNLLAGTVDVILETVLEPELGFNLMDRWNPTGEGQVFVKKSSQRFLSPQVRPSVQIEPAIHDVRVRAALYRALDREALSEGLQSGHRELAAWELVWQGEPLYEATKDAFRPYTYDPDRAKAELRSLGWAPGPDGVLRNDSDGRRFHTIVTATPGRIEREISAFADAWRRIGLAAEEQVVPAAFVRNGEYRANYPSWEASAAGGGDGILGRMEGPAASPVNRWTGNRGGYEDPRAQELLNRYRTSLSEREQLAAFKAISDFAAAELPMLILYSTAEHIAVRKGVKALDDHTGGESAGRNYGTYSRNSHLWEVE